MKTMYRDLLMSLRSSLVRNGAVQTARLIAHYLRFKKWSAAYYTFWCSPLNRTVSLRPGTSDFSVFRQIIMNGEYDIPISPDPCIIVDAGANIGMASLYFNHRFPKAVIYSLEPDPKNYKALQHQVSGISVIRTFHLALWRRKEKLAVLSNGADAWGIQVQASERQGDIDGIDLTSFMLEHNIGTIDLLKIDIEGAEIELFQVSFEYWLHRTRVLVIELHEGLRPGCEKIFFDAIKTIRHRMERSGENIVVYNLELI